MSYLWKSNQVSDDSRSFNWNCDSSGWTVLVSYQLWATKFI